MCRFCLDWSEGYLKEIFCLCSCREESGIGFKGIVIYYCSRCSHKLVKDEREKRRSETVFIVQGSSDVDVKNKESFKKSIDWVFKTVLEKGKK